MAVDSDRTDSTPPGSPKTAAGGLGAYPVLLLVVAGGYFGTLVGGIVSAWAIPRLLGYQLDWTRQATGVFAADGLLVGSAFRVAFASFPIVFAGGVVLVDTLLVRRLRTRVRPNRRALIGWMMVAFVALALMLLPVTPILPPYGLVRLLSTPRLGVIGVGIVAVVAGVAGLAGASIPISVYSDGMSFGGSIRQAGSDFRAAPGAVLTAVAAVVAGWTTGAVLLVVGSVVLALALGVFILGVVLLPIVLVVWLLAALAFASGHLKYRLLTVSDYSQRYD